MRWPQIALNINQLMSPQQVDPLGLHQVLDANDSADRKSKIISRLRVISHNPLRRYTQGVSEARQNAKANSAIAHSRESSEQFIPFFQ
jgi:hypothetical protein